MLDRSRRSRAIRPRERSRDSSSARPDCRTAAHRRGHRLLPHPPRRRRRQPRTSPSQAEGVSRLGAQGGCGGAAGPDRGGPRPRREPRLRTRRGAAGPHPQGTPPPLGGSRTRQAQGRRKDAEGRQVEGEVRGAGGPGHEHAAGASRGVVLGDASTSCSPNVMLGNGMRRVQATYRTTASRICASRTSATCDLDLDDVKTDDVRRRTSSRDCRLAAGRRSGQRRSGTASGRQSAICRGELQRLRAIQNVAHDSVRSAVGADYRVR